MGKKRNRLLAQTANVFIFSYQQLNIYKCISQVIKHIHQLLPIDSCLVLIASLPVANCMLHNLLII